MKRYIVPNLSAASRNCFKKIESIFMRIIKNHNVTMSTPSLFTGALAAIRDFDTQPANAPRREDDPHNHALTTERS